ncbi:MAG: DNA polymerase Y family protein [Hyphomicrobiales bacterium]|nr:DNA polymerase Y family protein [Hyphomicrobiales bacterium]
MRRYASIWLPRFRTDRLERVLGVDGASPIAVVEAGRIVAVNRAAELRGVAEGVAETEATALAPGLITLPERRGAASKELRRLAVWCRRFVAASAVEGDDGLSLDLSGAVPVGGEEGLLREVLARLHRFGFAATAGCADNAPASWALARFAESFIAIARAGDDAPVRALPIDALRIGEPALGAMKRAGFHRLGDIDAAPRETAANLAGRRALRRLDEMLGRRIAAAPRPSTSRHMAVAGFDAPQADRAEAIGAVRTLCAAVSSSLRAEKESARRFVLRLFHADGRASEIILHHVAATADEDVMRDRLLERVERVFEKLDAADAFDSVSLDVDWIETQGGERALALAGADIRRFVTQLESRFQGGLRLHGGGARCGVQVEAVPAMTKAPVASVARDFRLQPSRPEPVAVIADAFNWSPLVFTWRGATRKVVRAEGPFRADDGADASRPPELYAVDDERGERFWLRREWRQGAAPSWFLLGGEVSQ